MANLSERLSAYSLVGLDTPVFIFHLEEHPHYHNLTSEILDGIERGRWAAVTSVISLMEIIVHPYQLGRGDVAHKYEALLVNFPHLTILDVDRDIARRAAQLRAEFRLRPADAIQAAACLQAGCEILITNDIELLRLRPFIDVLLLDDLR